MAGIPEMTDLREDWGGGTNLNTILEADHLWAKEEKWALSAEGFGWLLSRLLAQKRGQELPSLYSLESILLAHPHKLWQLLAKGRIWLGKQAGHWAGSLPAAKPISLVDFLISAQQTFLETDASKSRSFNFLNQPTNTFWSKKRASYSRLQGAKAVLGGADLPSDRHEEMYFLHSSSP